MNTKRLQELAGITSTKVNLMEDGQSYKDSYQELLASLVLAIMNSDEDEVQRIAKFASDKLNSGYKS